MIIRTGWYKTRDGSMAKVTQVNELCKFPFYGEILAVPGGTRKAEIGVHWYEDGRYFESIDDDADLVEWIKPLEDAAPAPHPIPAAAPPMTTAAALAEETVEAAPPASQTAGAKEHKYKKHPRIPLRDYFAAHALTGLCFGHEISDPKTMAEMPEIMAFISYKMADAMLKARQKNDA